MPNANRLAAVFARALMRRRVARYGLLLAGALAAFAHPALPASAASAASDPLLTLSITEGPSGQPTAARISVSGWGGSSFRPEPDSLGFFHDALGGFFYAESLVTLKVAPESLRIRTSKGPEFRDDNRWVTVLGDTAIPIAIERWIDMRSLGWVSGDVHAHLTHTPLDYNIDVSEGTMMARAEGLHVVTFLEDNGTYFTGSVDPASDERVTTFVGQEYRSAYFGHMSLLGIDSPVFASGASGWPLTAETTVALRAHASALSVFAHPITTFDFWNVSTWPGSGLGRGIWVDAGLDALDALDVVSYSNGAVFGGLGFGEIQRLWNAGFRVPASAGSDAVMCSKISRPLGGARVYVRVPDPHAPPQLLYDAWVDAHRKGRTFVTSGPLLTSMSVGGAGVGETLAVASGEPVDVSVAVQIESAYGLGTVEIVVNGYVSQSVSEPGSSTITINTTVPIRETSWVTVRHVGPSQGPSAAMPLAVLLATPAVVLLAGDGQTSSDDAAHALYRIDLLDSLLGLTGSYPTSSESLAVWAGLDQARAAWTTHAAPAPVPFRLEWPTDGGAFVEAFPELRWGSALREGQVIPHTYRLVLAADAAFDSVLVDTAGLTDTTWTSSALSGVGTNYWWRVQAHDPSGQRRWAEEIGWTFSVIVNPQVSVGEGPRPDSGTDSRVTPGRPRLLAFPNPSRGPVALRLTAPALAGTTLRVFDLQGREVRSFRVPPGTREFEWDTADAHGRAVTSGVYRIQLASGEGVETRAVILVR